MQKIEQRLANLAFNFNIFCTDQTKPELIPLADHINIIYTNNITSKKNWLPPTAWIMLHRLSHALINCETVWSRDFQSSEGPERKLWCGLYDIWETAFGFTRTLPDWYESRGPYRFSPLAFFPSHLGVLATHLFTMKSAREKAISNELDIFAEAFAQFLYVGRFNMNRWEESGLDQYESSSQFVHHPSSSVKWGLQSGNQPMRLRVSPHEFNTLVEQVEARINDCMNDFAHLLVGKTIAF